MLLPFLKDTDQWQTSVKAKDFMQNKQFLERAAGLGVGFPIWDGMVGCVPSTYCL